MGDAQRDVGSSRKPSLSAHFPSICAGEVRGLREVDHAPAELEAEGQRLADVERGKEQLVRHEPARLPRRARPEGGASEGRLADGRGWTCA